LLVVGVSVATASPVSAKDTTVTPAVSNYASCAGGTSFPNSLSAQLSWDGSQWEIALDGRVTPWLLDTGITVQVSVVTASGRSTYHGTAGASSGQYYWAYPVTQNDLGLFAPGDSSTFWLHFAIPAQPDRDTCQLSASYSAPPTTPTQAPTPPPVSTPHPVPTLPPAPTPQPTPIPAVTQGSAPTLALAPTPKPSPKSNSMPSADAAIVADQTETSASPSDLASDPSSNTAGDLDPGLVVLILGLSVGLILFATLTIALLWDRRSR
jgi:hypothetical protein